MPDTRAVTNRGRDEGVALIAAIAGLVLASAIVLGMTSLARVEVLSSVNYKQLVQAESLTEAGLQRSIEWLSYSYPTYAGTTSIITYNPACYPVVPAGDTCSDDGVKLAGIDTSTANYPLNTVQTAFAAAMSGQTVAVDGTTNGTWSVDAEMLSVREVETGMTPPYTVETSERWLLTAEGTFLGATSRQTMVVERVFTNFFNNAMYGICAVDGVAGNAVTDSYHSDDGPYGGTNVDTIGAGVGSNGRVSTSGTSVAIGGDVSYGTGTGGCPAGDPTTVDPTVVSGDIDERPTRDFPPLPAMPASSGIDETYNSGVHVIVPGNYARVAANGSATLVLQGGTAAAPAVYNVDNLYEAGTATISIAPSGGWVVINVRGVNIPGPSPPGCSSTGLYLAGTGILSGSPPPPPETLRINYYGTNCMALTGTSTLSATIYAPDANVIVGGTTNMYGSVVGYRTTLNGDAQIHYDLSLADAIGVLNPGKVLQYSRVRF